MLLGLDSAKDTCRVGQSRCPPNSERVERSPLQFPVQEGRITAAKAPPRRRSATRAKCRKRAKTPSAPRRRRIPEPVNQSFGPSQPLGKPISLDHRNSKRQSNVAMSGSRRLDLFQLLRVLDHHIDEIFGVPEGLQNRFGLRFPVLIGSGPQVLVIRSWPYHFYISRVLVNPV